MAPDTTTSNTRAKVATTISKDFMAASVLLRAPQKEEAAITVDEILEELDRAGVVFGIDKDVIQKAVQQAEYNAPIKVATGRKPQKGVTASFVYHFDTSETLNGHIDYKDINFIQNTEGGALLVTKVPATPGQPGMSVLGKEIKGPNGRDLQFNHGTNTEVSDDGLKLHATASGAIQFQHGKVSVSDVISIKGDVDHNVGNIDCRGSVRVTGHVKAGYNLKLDGDLEVNGNVEDCNLDVGGSIYVKGGFFGEGSGVMKAGGDITVKFAEGQKMISGNDITVGGEIVNCRVIAKERVVVKGRRGKIIGGEVNAGREIRASVLGSDAGTATHLTVAYDHNLMTRHSQIIKEMRRLADDDERIKEALISLYRLQMDGKMTPDQQAAMNKLEQFQKDLPGNLESLEQQKADLEEEMKQFADAQIVAEETIYPGVRAQFGIVYREINEDKERCKLNLDGNKVLISELKGD
jgi:uncharacterized protein (DUF342 family)